MGLLELFMKKVEVEVKTWDYDNYEFEYVNIPEFGNFTQSCFTIRGEEGLFPSLYILFRCRNPAERLVKVRRFGNDGLEWKTKRYIEQPKGHEGDIVEYYFHDLGHLGSMSKIIFLFDRESIFDSS